MNEYEVGTTAKLDVVFKDANGEYTNPSVVSGWVYDPDGNQTVITDITNVSAGTYRGLYDIPATEGDYTYTYLGVTAGLDYKVVTSNFFVAVNYSNTDVDHLIPVLRFYLGDYETRRYLTDTLRASLIFAIRMLM
ncbi:unnamed protein product, partial [marine sediment metagenome]